MLTMTAKGLMKDATAGLTKADESGWDAGLGQRSVGRVVVSSAVGAGLLYAGVTHHNRGPWVIGTVLGGLNLAYNGVDVIKRLLG